jgi:putative aldouronate transport system permease protein
MPSKELQKRKKRSKWTKDDLQLTLLGLPTAIWFFVFSYLPMFGLILAFKKFRIHQGSGFFVSLYKSEWAGFDNFKFFLKSNTFTMLLRNTLLYNVVFIILGIVISVTLAIIINELYQKRLAKVYQTLMFFPHFLSWVVVSYFVFAFLSPDKGIINVIRIATGSKPIQWYSQPKYWPFILVIMQVWKTVGYSMVVYLASITGIDQSMYEAANLDGATRFQQALYITIPSIKPIIIMIFILNIGHIFYSDFGLFYQVTRGIPGSIYNAVSTFDTYIYQALRNPNVSIGQTAAASMFQSVSCCITVLLANWIVKKIDQDSAII